MSKLLSTTALCLGLSLAFAHAQGSQPGQMTTGAQPAAPATAPAPNQDANKAATGGQTTTQPNVTVTTTPIQPAPAGTSAPAREGTAQTAPANQPNVTVTTTPAQPGAAQTGAATSGETYLQAQTRDQLSADDLIGASVRGAGEENIGEVTDILLDQTGRVVAVVVGVGGFLGIGEKEVAVSFDQLKMQQEDDGDLRLSLNETKEQLEAAPEFTYLEDQGNAGSPNATGSVRDGASDRPGATTSPSGAGTGTAPRQ